VERPNVVLIITDQQRHPMHWPDDPAWLRELTPNDVELARTGLSFSQATVNSCMCSPSRATLFTGLYPTQHGVTLTLTEGGVLPDPRHLPAVARTFATTFARAEAPRQKIGRAFLRSALRRGAGEGDEQLLRPETPNLARMLAEAGYHVGFKGKWHLTKPLDGEWSDVDAKQLDSVYGFSGWEPPDAGENVEPEHFGGGNAGRSGEGWDEDFTRQAERFIAEAREPFALILSLVNPHDVLGYPESYADGGYNVKDFRDFGVGLPPTLDERLGTKPSPHAVMKLGQSSYLGPVAGREAQLDYVNFYAYLHKLVDEKVGRVLAALGDASDPDSLRSRTLVVRTSDHGEMGLSHGGLRQKMFNAYEETVRVPLVFSNPRMFPEPRATSSPAGLIDLMPTLASLCGAEAPAGLPGADLSPVIEGAADEVQDAAYFVYEDHKAGTAFENVVPQPNRIRCVREPGWKYAVYFDPAGEASSEYELYDLSNDPHETRNLLDRSSGQALDRAHEEERRRLHDKLVATMSEVDALPAAARV
jgi:arylsulfatase A-like enzyme